MRRWLALLPHETLVKIAADLGFAGGSRQQTLDFVVEQAKTHRWTTEDLKARWRLD